MAIELKEKKLTYFEKEERFILNYNGKDVIIYYYAKQDPQFGDYEGGYEIIDKEKFTNEEQEEIMDYIESEED